MVILVTLKGSCFVYLQVFPKISELYTITLPSRFSDPTWQHSTLVELVQRPKKILKKTDGKVLLADEAWFDIREVLWQRSNQDNDGENERKYTCEMEDFFRVNPGLSRGIPIFLEFNDYTSMEVVEIANKILFTYKDFIPTGFQIC